MTSICTSLVNAMNGDVTIHAGRAVIEIDYANTESK